MRVKSLSGQTYWRGRSFAMSMRPPALGIKTAGTFPSVQRASSCSQRLTAPSLAGRIKIGERPMAQEPLAKLGHYLHIYDFRVVPGREDEFIQLFEDFDYSDGNPMHKSAAQVKDGVLCRDTDDPSRLFLIAEWADIEEHARIRKILANEIKPA